MTSVHVRVMLISGISLFANNLHLRNIGFSLIGSPKVFSREESLVTVIYMVTQKPSLEVSAAN
jgi:hypothetical protein